MRTRGERYLDEGRVALADVRPAMALAHVQGSSSRRYDVTLRWLDGGTVFLAVECTCPHYERGDFCKHLWATVVQLDLRGWPGKMDPAGEVVLLHALDTEMLEGDEGASGASGASWSPELDEAASHPEGEPDDDLDDDADDEAPWVPLAERAQWGRFGTRSQAGWRGVLGAALGAGAPRPPADAPARLAWFVVNPDASMRAGGLVVDFFHRRARKDGSWGAVQREGVGERDLGRYPDPEDRRLLGLLIGNEPAEAPHRASPWHHWDQDGRSSGRRIAPAMSDLLLPALCATGRLVWHESVGRDPQAYRALAWDGDRPWSLRLRIETQEGRQCWRIVGALERPSVEAQGLDRASLAEVLLALDDGLLVFAGRLGRLGQPRHAVWLRALVERGDVIVPFAEREAFLTHWWTLPEHPPAALPPALELAPERVPPRGHVRIRTPAAGRTRLSARDATLEVGFEYDGHRLEPETPSAAVVDVARQRVIPRDAEAEKALVERLEALGARPAVGLPVGHQAYRLGGSRVGELELALAAEGWVVETDGVRVRAAGDVSVQVDAAIDWFDLRAELDFDGLTVAMPELLRAARAGASWVRLADGSRGALPDAWLDGYARLAAVGEAHGDSLRFAPSQALLLDALLASDRTRVDLDERFTAWRDRLRRFDGIHPMPAPATFRGALRPYQLEGLGWMRFLDEIGVGGCLADDMGLGKTVQALAWLEHCRMRREAAGEARVPSLVVAPRSLVWNWIDEAARFVPGMRVLDYTGTARRPLLEQIADHDLVVTTYGTVRQDITALREIGFEYVVLDEAQAIKNASSQAAKACRLLHARRRLAMSGTPVENHLGELWSLFEFLEPGLLGSASAFESVVRPGARSDPEAARVLGEGLRPFILRRTKAQVLDDLPEKTEQTVVCELPPRQRKLYDELRDYYRAELDRRIATSGLGRSKIAVLEALLRLRQAACHPGLVDRERVDESSAKLESLMESLRDVIDEGHKALVFSQFTRLLAIVRTALEREGIVHEYLDGRTRDRAARVERFQTDPDCPVFLVSLKAGGHGLNLTAADYVFILDPWWNPAVEAQAVDRAHRIGQARPVFAYRLIAKDTVEEKILALQDRKRELADAIVAGGEGVMRSLTEDDLALLLG
ncbi:MAG: DEAD/DEAH box helicase [Ectothiorhodospiraceae bacterium]|nr:DEAD/DEAH box helicase [Ectothiorhodospiraceae bacterium]